MPDELVSVEVGLVGVPDGEEGLPEDVDVISLVDVEVWASVLGDAVVVRSAVVEGEPVVEGNAVVDEDGGLVGVPDALVDEDGGLVGLLVLVKISEVGVA